MGVAQCWRTAIYLLCSADRWRSSFSLWLMRPDTVRHPRVVMLATVLVLVACTPDDDQVGDGENVYAHLGGDFTLTDHQGRLFSLHQHPGPVLLFFGFTSCPDVCPLTMSRLTAIMAQLGPEPSVTVLFVSIDPRRDTPQRLATYVGDYDFPLLGLTAVEQGKTAAVARQFAAGLSVSGDGSIDHSSRIYLLDADHIVRDVFGSDDEIDHIVRVIQTVSGTR